MGLLEVHLLLHLLPAWGAPWRALPLTWVARFSPRPVARRTCSPVSPPPHCAHTHRSTTPRLTPWLLALTFVALCTNYFRSAKVCCVCQVLGTRSLFSRKK